MPAINTNAIDLFTPDEDAILACWFGVDPPASAKAIDVAEAIERLGFVICSDWQQQRDEWCQQRWAYLFGIGLVSDKEATIWALLPRSTLCGLRPSGVLAWPRSNARTACRRP